MTPPEATLVTLCTREPDAVAPGAIAAAAAAVRDWDAVVELAARHRALAYLRAGLARDQVRPPARAERAMGQLLLMSGTRLVRLRDALRRVAGAFATEGIPLIVLKGPVLAPALYPGAIFRPFSDIDVLVPEAHVERAAELIEACGLPERAHGAAVAQAEHADHVHDAADYHRQFATDDWEVLVELHADALQLGMRLSPERDRWVRSVPADGVAGVSMLSMEDQVVHLSTHAHKHGFNRLIWLKDIDLLVRRRGQTLDWPLALAIAREEGVTASLWYALELTRALLGTPVPRDWLRQVRPVLPVRLAYRAVWPEADIARLEGHMRRRAVQFHVADSWRGMLPSLLLMGRRQVRARAIVDALLH
ncbi:MAG: nucleotidyltransferase family protein [Chloroflexi bacterium]|nr:nucleotidyltransferase family protein [Chloroflexota bacterium]